MKTTNYILPLAAFAAGALFAKSQSGAAVGKVSTKDLNAQVFPYILDAIDTDGYDVEADTNKEKLQFLFDTFKSEYGWMIARKGLYGAFTEWLQGVPTVIRIDIYNSEILELAEKWGSIPHNATSRQEDKIIDNWFNFITNKTFQLFRKYGIN
jgi:hypothetical protein